MTLESLVEGLRKLIRSRRGKKPFRLRKATFRGRGFHPDFRDASWERIRDEIYNGRGA